MHVKAALDDAAGRSLTPASVPGSAPKKSAAQKLVSSSLSSVFTSAWSRINGETPVTFWLVPICLIIAA